MYIVINGESLASALNNAIDAMVTDDRSRPDVISAMGSAAGIESGTVNSIISGSINCPPISRLEGFAEALNVSMSSLQSAAEDDGCSYDLEGNCDLNRKNELIANSSSSRIHEMPRLHFNKKG